MLKKVFLISIVLMLCVSNIAVAGRTWIKTPVEVDGMPVNGPRCALAMRSGNTWPVVSYGDPDTSATAAMTPVGWMAGPFGGPVDGGISAATSPGGTAGFAYDNGSVLMLSQSGWATSYYGSGTNATKPSIAFNGDDNPAVLHNTGGFGDDLTLAIFNGTGWYQNVVENAFEGPFLSEAFALEYDSYNQANIVFENGGELMFGVKGVMTQNQWQFDTIELSLDVPIINMAMGADDVPWITYADEGELCYATYDRQLQTWTNGVIDQLGSEYFSMAIDNTGGIGVAFIDTDDMLTFSHNDGGGWVSDTDIAQVLLGSDVSLAFDADDNPLICYSDFDHGGDLYLAYDPVMVPEPATVVLLAIGTAILRRRRRA